jgi:hypothetical protein
MNDRAEETLAQRRLAHEQALASTRIEGHVPTAEFLADCAAVVAGSMTRDQARAASLARALIRDWQAQATHENSRSCSAATAIDSRAEPLSGPPPGASES